MKRIIFDGCTLSDVLQGIRQIIREELDNSDNKVTQFEELIDLKEAAEYLKISPNTLYEYTCKLKIPHTKPGKKLLFLKSELLAWVKAARVKTLQEIEEEANTHILNHSKKDRV